jgi:hypothetical protein
MNASTKPTAALLSVFFLWLATSFSGTAQEASGTRPEADPSAALFGGPGLVFELHVSEEGIASLRRKPRENVAADLTVGADKWVVAVRIKGSAGSVKPVDDRPALSIDCDKLVEGQRIFGLKRFYLNNSAQDLARMHECLAYEFHTRLGIPVARVTHALVKLNGRELGVYVLKEGYDKTVLGRHFAKKSGNLYDAPLGKDVTDDLELDSGKEPADYADLKALRAAIAEPDLARRLAMFERCLELEHFIAMTALQAFTADWDGYCYGANNYRIYVPPETGRAVFIPCGVDYVRCGSGMIVGNYCESAGHRFDHNVAKGLAGAGEKEDVRGGVMFGQRRAGLRAGEQDARLLRLQGLAFGAVADHHQTQAA